MSEHYSHFVFYFDATDQPSELLIHEEQLLLCRPSLAVSEVYDQARVAGNENLFAAWVYSFLMDLL